MTCQHKNRIENVQRKGDALIARVTCRDCDADLELDYVLALERAEKAEAKNNELESIFREKRTMKESSKCMIHAFGGLLSTIAVIWVSAYIINVGAGTWIGLPMFLTGFVLVVMTAIYAIGAVSVAIEEYEKENR